MYTIEDTRIAPQPTNDLITIIVITFIGGIGGIGIYFYRTSKKPVSHENVIERAKVKEKAILDDLKIKIQNTESKKQNNTKLYSKTRLGNSKYPNLDSLKPKPKSRPRRR
jgi:hypothetical protein